MERVSRAFLFHEALASQDEGATLEEALEHVFWWVNLFVSLSHFAVYGQYERIMDCVYFSFLVVAASLSRPSSTPRSSVQAPFPKKKLCI